MSTTCGKEVGDCNLMATFKIIFFLIWLNQIVYFQFD
jgi:hypothetical protein